MMLPKRRRQGLKRLNTNLKILVEDAKNPANSECESYEEQNDGVFYSHGNEYIYDQNSLWIFSADWKIRKFIVWIIVWS